MKTIITGILLTTLTTQAMAIHLPPGNTTRMEQRILKLEREMATIKYEARKRGIDLR